MTGLGNISHHECLLHSLSSLCYLPVEFLLSQISLVLQMRDRMLPAIHSAGEALRNFTGLLDDADQRAIFRQRDAGPEATGPTAAAAAAPSRAPPAPNSAAQAPAEVRVGEPSSP